MNLSQINEAVEAFLWRIGLRGPLPYYWVLIPFGAGISLILIAGLMMPFRSSYANEYWTVCRLATNPDVPSQVYVDLGRYGCYNSDPVAYQSNDFGATWEISSYRFMGDSWATSPNALANLSLSGDVLIYQGQTIWESSRRIFRMFFSPNGYGGGNYYHYGETAQSAVSGDGTTVYVALGQNGVLIGPNPERGVRSDGWRISREGIAELVPQPLTITHPFLVLVIIGLALLIPPLPWLHSWLLGQVWRHVLPADEQETAYHLGFLTAVQISVVAVFAIVMWLGNLQIDFYHIVGAMTLVTVGISVSQAVNLGQQMELEHGTRRRLALATGVVALIVPIGVATTPVGVGWPIIITLITGFMIYRRILTSYRNYMMIDISSWQIDRLAIEMVALAGVAVVTFTVFFAALGPQLNTWGVFGVPLLSIVTVGVYSTGRGQSFMPVKKSDEGGFYLLFNSAEWRGSLFWNSLYWLGAAFFMAAVVVIAQGGVYAWFMTLGQY